MFVNQKEEMAASCSGPTIKKHILQVSTHQMTILMLFNKRSMLSFQVRCIFFAVTVLKLLLGRIFCKKLRLDRRN